MKRLVINADDFGLTAGVNRGITEAIAAGSVTSTSCLVYGESPAIPEVLRGKVGIHLRLTDGFPVSNPRFISSLLANGRFLTSRAAVRERGVDLDEVAIEWRAQIEMFSRSGVRPTHIDTHHHSHSIAGIAGVYAAMASEMGVSSVGLDSAQVFDLKSRGVRCADHAEIEWDVLGRRGIREIITAAFAAGNETVYLMAHPGYVDDDLVARSSMIKARRMELDILLSPQFRRDLQDDGISLIGMAEL